LYRPASKTPLAGHVVIREPRGDTVRAAIGVARVSLAISVQSTRPVLPGKEEMKACLNVFIGELRSDVDMD
jgi:hypothetical protein